MNLQHIESFALQAKCIEQPRFLLHMSEYLLLLSIHLQLLKHKQQSASINVLHDRSMALPPNRFPLRIIK